MDLEFKDLRIFCRVMEEKGFSSAARSLGITQPTVSLHVARIEKEYGTRLFERVGHEVIPNSAASELYDFASGVLERMQEFQESVLENRETARGLVRYAMPETCQWTPHFRKIMGQIRELPEIRFEIDIVPSERIVEGLLEAKYDFGFVVGEKLAPELRFEKFSDERYSWVAASRELLDAKTVSPRLISFPGWELFFTTWAKSHGVWKDHKSRLQEATIKIGTLTGAIHAVSEGAGVAVVPTHCVADLLGDGRLAELRPSKTTQASNPIYLAKRVGAKLPRRVEVVIDLLRKAKAELG
ncbi:MAG: LysR family transcriptional regulator [Bdellovibrionota bacterium]